MTDETIFTTPPVVAAVPPAATVPAGLPQDVLEFVGQGKKYANADEALKSVPHAQKHIQSLSEELVATKAELEKRKTAEHLLEEIKRQNVTTPADTQSPNGLTSETVSKMIKDAQVAEQSQQVAKINATKVSDSFVAKYGDKAEEVYNTLAAEAGLSVQMLNQLAATSPLAVLKLAGMTGAVSAVGKSSSSINTESLRSTDPNGTLSARVKQGASTKDLVAAWKIAGQKIGKPNS